MRAGQAGAPSGRTDAAAPKRAPAFRDRPLPDAAGPRGPREEREPGRPPATRAPRAEGGRFAGRDSRVAPRGMGADRLARSRADGGWRNEEGPAVRGGGEAGKQRRALSMPRAPGALSKGGAPEAADALVQALIAAGRDTDRIAESLTHPIHSYPARMHPATVRVMMELLSQTLPRRALIADPFCGSGTVLVEARAAGFDAIGGDLNPLAVLLARAKTWMVPSRSRDRLRQQGRRIAGEALLAGKSARRSAERGQAPKRAPDGFDPNARDRRLSRWFAPHVRRELEDLAGRIDATRGQDAELADVLTVALSAILYKASSRTSDTNPAWVNRTIGRGQASRWFADRVELLAAGLDDLYASFSHAERKGAGGPPKIEHADARKLGEYAGVGKVSAIVTSPPYAGTYDYAEHQRLRFDFLGLRHREFDAGEIGARRSFENVEAGETAWQRALAQTLDGFAQALMPNGLALVVMGDSLANARAHYALDDVRAALTDEFVLEAWASQERPMLGAGERRAFGERPKAEHIMMLRRV